MNTFVSNLRIRNSWEDDDESYMENLPDIILLQIFSNLMFQDLCKCAQVCHRWYALSHSSSLRRNIILTKRLKPCQFPVLVKNHFHKDLESFSWLLEADGPLVPIRRATFYRIHDKCESLKRLTFITCSLSGVSFEDLPETLSQLSVRFCELNPIKFFGNHPQNCLPYLTCLDLAGVTNFLTSEELYMLNNLKTLKHLFLQGCFRVNSAGLESIIPILPNLEIFDLEGTDISNESFEFIFKHCTALKKIYFGYTSITDDIFCNIDCNILQIKVICIKRTNVSEEGLRSYLKEKLSHHRLFSIDRVLIMTSPTPKYCYHDYTNQTYSSFFGCDHYLSHICES